MNGKVRKGRCESMLKQAQEKRKTELHKNFLNCDIAVYCQQLDYGHEIRILGGQRSHVGAVTVSDEQGDLQDTKKMSLPENGLSRYGNLSNNRCLCWQEYIMIIWKRNS